MKQQKSAKDLAFEKERIKYRQEIRKLSAEIEKGRKENAQLYEIIREKDELLRQKEEWIERLLAHTELSKDDLRTLLTAKSGEQKHGSI